MPPSEPLLPDGVAENSEKFISPTVSIMDSGALFEGSAAISDDVIDTENEKVVFSFSSYEQNKCELKDLDKRDAKELTQTLQKVSELSVKNLLESKNGVDCKPVNKSGNYSNLYDNVPKDVDIREICYSNAGRIFGHIVNSVFFITAIKKKHIKIK